MYGRVGRWGERVARRCCATIFTIEEMEVGETRDQEEEIRHHAYPERTNRRAQDPNRKNTTF
ncbi:hypothetical protein BKA81DRAFT_344698 [Phyllosticta paracitricarpa]